MPKIITLIGCDFSSDRSKQVIEDNKAYNLNPFNNANIIYKFLEKYLLNEGVILKNNSWLL